MAECTAYTSIVVSDAGTAAANGTYISAGLDGNGNQVYTKDGNINSTPKLNRPSATTWSIVGIPFPQAPMYNSPLGLDTDCPELGVYTANVFGSGTATVTGTPAASENTFGLPADVVALITSRFGTVANFLRLRNQGQI